MSVGETVRPLVCVPRVWEQACELGVVQLFACFGEEDGHAKADWMLAVVISMHGTVEVVGR